MNDVETLDEPAIAMRRVLDKPFVHGQIDSVQEGGQHLHGLQSIDELLVGAKVLQRKGGRPVGQPLLKLVHGLAHGGHVQVAVFRDAVDVAPEKGIDIGHKAHDIVASAAASGRDLKKE